MAPKGKRTARARRTATAAPSMRTRQRLAAQLEAARAGEAEFRWLNALVLAAGYAPAAVGAADAVYVTTRQLAVRLKVSRRTLQAWAKEGMPIAVPGLGSRPNYYDPFEVMEWWRQREDAARQLAGGDELLMQGKGSPWLERYREQMARKIQRENDMAEGVLIAAADVAQRCRLIGEVFRREAEAIERAYGGEVGDAIRGMVDRTAREWEQVAGRAEVEEAGAETKGETG